MQEIEIPIINHSENPLPMYQTIDSAGMDLHAYIHEHLMLEPGERVLIPTGLHISLPRSYEAQIRPRSGLALKHGVTVLNSPGTIDADYRGEIKVLLINHGQETFTIKNGERIAQMVIAEVGRVHWKPTHSLDETERGSGGYGSSGK